MEEHINALALICRICGQITTSSKNKSKLAKYKKELLAIYNLDVDEDQVDIHPSIMCNKCRGSMQRAHSSMRRGKPFGGILPQIKTFQPHTYSSCSVCRGHATHKSLLRPQFAVAGPSTSTGQLAPPELQAGPSTSTSVPPELQAGPSTSTSAPPELQAGPSTSTSAPPELQQAGSSTASMPPPQPSLSTTTKAPLKDTTPDHATRGKKRMLSVKANLKDVRRDHARKRTKEASTFISGFCGRQKENQLDLLFFLLTENLRESCDSRYKEVFTSWKQETTKPHHTPVCSRGSGDEGHDKDINGAPPAPVSKAEVQRD